jgi:hypothetical protein
MKCWLTLAMAKMKLLSCTQQKRFNNNKHWY